MAEHAALAETAGAMPNWLTRTGNLEWAEDEAGAERLAASVAELTGRDYPVDWITPQLARELVPDLRVPPGVRDIAHYPTEGHVIPALLVARLWGEARDHGAELRCPAAVTGLSEVDDGVRVELSDGAAEVDAVVIATGRWTEELTAAAGHRVPMASPDVAGSATLGLLGYRNAGQCSALQGGGEGSRWEGREGPSSALSRTVLLFDVLLHDAQRCPADGACEVRARPEFVGSVVVAYEVGNSWRRRREDTPLRELTRRAMAALGG